MNKNQKVFIVMIRDVSEPDFGGSSIINECAVFSTAEQARAHLNTVVEDYKTSGIGEYLDNEDVGFDVDTEKSYVLLESEDNFTYYAQGCYNYNHIEVWITEQEVNQKEDN